MPWTIPDKGEGQNDIQSILFQEYIDVLVAGIGGQDCVLGGGVVTAQGSPNMTVAVANAAVLSNGVMFSVPAGNATITAANATLPRIDMVCANVSGSLVVHAGTPSAAPKPGVRSANDVALAAVYVPAADTTIGSDQITDMRAVRTVGPLAVKRASSAVTFNTSNAIQTYFNAALPVGLFLAGRQLHVRCGGTYLNNSGANATWTLTLSFGGTNMFVDAPAAVSADADRGAWQVDVMLNASANNAQQIDGVVSFQTPGAKTAPTTGTAGDLAVVTHVAAPVRGVAAVDVTTADRTFAVQWTMNTSNANVETVCDYGIAELL